jgi:hypothetical protein
VEVKYVITVCRWSQQNFGLYLYLIYTHCSIYVGYCLLYHEIMFKFIILLVFESLFEPLAFLRELSGYYHQGTIVYVGLSYFSRDTSSCLERKYGPLFTTPCR